MPSHPMTWHDDAPASCRGGAVGVGNFDGVHRGHAALVAGLVELAAAAKGPAVVITFDPHPLSLLRPGIHLELLTTIDDRARFLQALGVNEVVALRATPDLLALEAREFFDQVVRQRLGAKAMAEGANFRFGHDRAGDVTLLAALCREAGMTLRVVPAVLIDGGEISSSRIRQALAAGDVGLVTRLLGRAYSVRGGVAAGARRGRTIGFPTANLEGIATVLPGPGVYAGRARTAGGSTWPAAVNVGANPTFGEQAVKVEAHLIGFGGDLYGQEIEVEFLARLRETRPFAGVAELVAQLRQDVEQARRIAEAAHER